MIVYKLTMTWLRGTKVVVTKELKNSIEASKWKTLCGDICGRNEHGELFNSSKIENITKKRG